MSEKRFECVFIEDDEFGGTFRRLKDNETGIMHMTCDVVDLLNFQNTQIKILKEENEQLKKQNKLTSEFFVVRENDKIIALFTSEQRAKFYCRENLANLHYQKEEWIIKERVVRFDE